MRVKPPGFVKFAQRNNIPLTGEQRRAFQRLKVPPPAANVITSATNLSSSFRIDQNLTAAQLQQLLDNPALLEIAMVRDDSTVCLTAPKTKKELVEELRQVFDRSHSEGMSLLDQLRAALPEKEFAFCLKATVLLAAKGFGRGEEEVKLAYFEFWLAELCQLADHELNRAVLQELAVAAVHGRAWLEVALAEFSKVFPAESGYHRLAADHYARRYQQTDELPLGREAVKAYRLAAGLEPERQKAAPPRRRRIISTARPQLKLRWSPARPLAENLRILQNHLAQRENLLHGQLAGLWARISLGGGAGQKGKPVRKAKKAGRSARKRPLSRDRQQRAARLIEIISELGLAEFEKRYEALSRNDSPRRCLEKLELLAEVAEARGFSGITDYFDRLGDAFLSETLAEFIAGEMFEGEPREELDAEAFKKLMPEAVWQSIPPPIKQIELPQRLVLLLEYFRTDRVQAIDSSLLSRLSLAHQAEEQQAAPADYRRLLRYVILSSLVEVLIWGNAANKAELMTITAEQLLVRGEGERAEAKTLLERALTIDPACITALDKLAALANLEANHSQAIAYARRIIERQEGGAALFSPNRIKIIYAGQSMERFSGKILTSAYAGLGYASLMRFRETLQPLFLQQAIEALASSLRRGGPVSLNFLLARAYVFDGRYQKALASLKKYLEAEPAKVTEVLGLAGTGWASIWFAQDSPDEFLEFVTAHCFAYFKNRAGADEKLEYAMVNHAISLLDYGWETAARQIFDHFARTENLGKDSYYYAQYGLALAAFKAENYGKARSFVMNIIEDPRATLLIHNDEVGERLAIKAEAYNLLFQTYLGAGKKPPGRLLERALKEFPDNPVVLQAVAVAYEKRNNFARAGELYEQALAAAPCFMRSYLNYLRLLLRAGQPEAAAVVAQRLSGQVSAILRMAAADREQINYLSSSFFLLELLSLYHDYKYEPLLDLLGRLGRAGLPRLKEAFKIAGERLAGAAALPAEVERIFNSTDGDSV